MIRSEARNGSRTARAAALAVMLAIGCVIALAIPGRASAGELAYKGCISDDGTPRVSDKKACTAIGKGEFGFLTTLALSPDGEWLYAGNGIECGGNDSPWCHAVAAVDRFQRFPRSGALDYYDCLTGATEEHRTCVEIPSAREHALGAGLGDVRSMAVSPDGTSLYAASPLAKSPFGRCYPYDIEEEDCYGSNALARFDRDPQTGEITYVDCITGDRRSGPSGSGACIEIPSATDDGSGSGLDGLRSIVLSEDGGSLYGAAGNSIVRFDRDPNTGVLTYRDCITGDRQLGPSGSGACMEIPSATDNGLGSGLGELQSIVLSDDGTSLYGAAYSDVFRFDRDTHTGALTYRGCITGDIRLGPSGSGACSAIPSATPQGGNRSGLGGPVSLAVSLDGRSLYVGAAYSDAIARFDRRPATGAITFVGCLTGDTRVGPSGSGACHQIRSATRQGAGSGLPEPYSLVLGARGRSLFAASGATVARVRLNRATGALRYAGCLTGYKDLPQCKEIRTAAEYRGSGLRDISDLAASGKTLYAAAQGDGDIATFAIAPQTKIRTAKTRGHRAIFRFQADSPSKFRCKLKGESVSRKERRWRRCGSHGFMEKGKQVYRGLGSGKKVFRVRATDRADTTDPSPAKAAWRVR